MRTYAYNELSNKAKYNAIKEQTEQTEKHFGYVPTIKECVEALSICKFEADGTMSHC